MVTFFAILVAPAMPVACYRQIREHGFHWRLIAASLLSLIALALLGLSFYWLIHHDRATQQNATLQTTHWVLGITSAFATAGSLIRDVH